MSESLIIHLRDGAAPQWLVCNHDGQVIVNAVSGELSQATPMSAGRRVAVIVPASEALITDSDAPARSASKLAQVVPYALEERVADEIENLHFAIGERREAGARVPVVVVKRDLVQGWLAELTAAGLAPSAIYCAATLLPSMPGQMIALLDGDTITVRVGDALPLVLPTLSIADAFEMALATQQSQVAGLEPAPLGLLLYTGQEEWQAHQDSIDALRDRFTGVKVQLLPSGPIAVLAPAAAAGDAINLLQGALALSSPVQARWQSWRLAAMLAGALVALHIGSQWFELSRLEKNEVSLDSGIEDAFRAAMPGQRTRRTRGAVSSFASPKCAVVAAARCCPRCPHWPRRAGPRPRRTSKASRSVTARCSCASARRMRPVSTPSASSCAPHSGRPTSSAAAPTAKHTAAACRSRRPVPDA